MRKYVVVLVTASSRNEGEKIARALVQERLAACVNVLGPVTSLFNWRGKFSRAREVLLVIKTREALFKRLSLRVKALHSYEVPEIIAVPIAQGWLPYLRWIGEETK